MSELCTQLFGDWTMSRSHASGGHTRHTESSFFPSLGLKSYRSRYRRWPRVGDWIWCISFGPFARGQLGAGKPEPIAAKPSGAPTIRRALLVNSVAGK